jgi:hypothetical protein
LVELLQVGVHLASGANRPDLFHVVAKEDGMEARVAGFLIELEEQIGEREPRLRPRRAWIVGDFDADRPALNEAGIGTGNPVSGLRTAWPSARAACGSPPWAGWVAAGTTAGSTAEPGSKVAAAESALVASGVAACEPGATSSESP